jgi:hypothetical protein
MQRRETSARRIRNLTSLARSVFQQKEGKHFSLAECSLLFRTPQGGSSNRRSEPANEPGRPTSRKQPTEMTDRSCQGLSPLTGPCFPRCEGAHARPLITRHIASWCLSVPASKNPATANGGDTNRAACGNARRNHSNMLHRNIRSNSTKSSASRITCTTFVHLLLPPFLTLPRLTLPR